MNAGDQLVLAEWLAHKVIRTQPQAHHHIDLLAFGREEQYRHTPVLLTHATTHLVAIHPRHHDVQTEQIRLVLLPQRQRLAAILGQQHLKTLRPQACGQ